MVIQSGVLDENLVEMPKNHNIFPLFSCNYLHIIWMDRLLNLDSMHRVIQLYSILIGPKGLS